MPELEKLTHEAFIEKNSSAVEVSHSVCQSKVEDYYWEVDGLQRIITDEFIILLKNTQTQILALTQKAAAHMYDDESDFDPC